MPANLINDYTKNDRLQNCLIQMKHTYDVVVVVVTSKYDDTAVIVTMKNVVQVMSFFTKCNLSHVLE